MVTQEQGSKLINGVNVYDVVLVTQIIEKLLRGGLITGKELGHVFAIRNKLLSLVKNDVGIDLDNPEKEENDG